MLRDLNHITLSISDLTTSIRFYREIVGMQLHARWDHGAYLTLGNLWFCLSVDNDDKSKQVRNGNDKVESYSHIAFSIDSSDDLASFLTKLGQKGVRIWKENTSEGASVYFLDPDGHKLEAHIGTLESRLASLKNSPYKGLELFE